MKTDADAPVSPIGAGGAITTGLSKRELFAAMAMQAIIPSMVGHINELAAAEMAVEFADRLIKELNQKESK